MPEVDTEIQALNALAYAAYTAMALIAVHIVALGFVRPRSKLTLLVSYAMWVGFALILAWLTFHPAIRAMKFVGSPWLFVGLGSVAAAILFAVRNTRKDLYGLIEVAVALLTLALLGREYDVSGQLTVVVALVGAIYVMVRGFTNIIEHWTSLTEKDKTKS